MKHLRLIAALTMLLFAADSYAQGEKIRVAVLDPNVAGTQLGEGTIVTIREMISAQIVNVGNYNIVERSLLDKVMTEQAFSNSGAVDEGQATEIGKLTGASKVLVTIVSETGNMNMLSVKLIDVKTASVDKQKIKVVKPTLLLASVEPIMNELLGVSAQPETATVAQEIAYKPAYTKPEPQVKESYGGYTPAKSSSNLIITDNPAQLKPGMKYRKLKKIYNAREYSYYKDDMDRRYSPAVAGITSFLIPGLGQMICGEVGRGLGNMVLTAGLTIGGSVLLIEYDDEGAYAASTTLMLMGYAYYIWQIIGATKIAKVKNMYFNDLKHSRGVSMNLTPYVDYACLSGHGVQPITGMSLRVTF